MYIFIELKNTLRKNSFDEFAIVFKKVNIIWFLVFYLIMLI